MAKETNQTDTDADANAQPNKRPVPRLLIIVGVLSVLVWIVSQRSDGPSLQNLSLHDTPRSPYSIAFSDSAGTSLGLDSFAGKFVLLNIWATWCGPCRKEMPALDRLQSALGSDHFEVVALSIDRQGAAVVSPFYNELGVKHLATYIDPSGKSQDDLRVYGIPTTLLIDRTGREIGRLVGAAQWDAPEMIDFISDRIAGKKIEPGDYPVKSASPSRGSLITFGLDGR